MKARRSSSHGRAVLPTALAFGALIGCSSGSDETGTVSQALTGGGLSGTLTLQSDWGSGYCANVALSNTSTAATTSWQVVIGLNQSTVSSSWSGTFTTAGATLTVTPLSWNASLSPGSSTSFGFCANATGSNDHPTLTSISASGTGAGGGTVDAGPVDSGAKDSGTTAVDSGPKDSGTTAVDSGPKDGGTSPPPDGGSTPPSNTGSVHASGNQIFDGTKAIRLLGADRPGTEYSCVSGNIFDPADGSGNNAATVTAMKTWGVNAVRIPLNEDCWLALNGIPGNASGTTYQNAIKTWVTTLIQGGMYPILDLHWTENNGAKATGQQPMPDAAHAVAFWSSVATAFASQPKVIFDLFNEPFPDMNMEATAAWQCWKSGGTCPGVGYSVAGMQTMLTAVRNAGAKNLVILAGIEFANDLSQWLTFVPTDPANNIAASWHVYNNSNYTSNHSLASDAGPVLAKYPIVASEIGDINGPCDGAFIGTVMSFLDSPGNGVPPQSYLGWSWSTDNTPSLISDYSGTPRCDGASFKAHVLAQPH